MILSSDLPLGKTIIEVREEKKEKETGNHSLQLFAHTFA